MAGETYLDLAGILASFPENTANLIQPVDMRNAAIGLANDLGFMEDDGSPFTITIVDGVPVSAFSSINLPVVVGQAWTIDGNQNFIPDLLPGLNVPPGHTRLLSMVCEMFVNKVGAGLDSYDFQWFVGGVATGRIIHIIDLDTSPTQLTMDEQILYDYSTELPIDLRVTGVGTSDDIDVDDIAARVIGILI